MQPILFSFNTVNKLYGILNTLLKTGFLLHDIASCSLMQVFGACFRWAGLTLGCSVDQVYSMCFRCTVFSAYKVLVWTWPVLSQGAHLSELLVALGQLV